MATKSFPILELPYIPLSIVLKNLNQMEVLDFSFVSKKCQLIIKSIKFAEFKISLSLQPTRSPIVFYHNSLWIFRFTIDDLKKRNKYLKGKTKTTKYFYKGDTICAEFAKKWTDYICSLFRRDVSYLRMNTNASLEDMTIISKWMNKRQSTLEYCDLTGCDTNSKSIELFFKKAKFSINRLSYELTQPYEMKPFSCGILDATEFFATSTTSECPVNWIKTDEIINSSCERILIEACSFDENDIYRILKGWVEGGGHSRMKFFSAAVKILDFELLLDGIEFEEKDESLIRPFKFDFMGKEVQYYIYSKEGSISEVRMENLRRFNRETHLVLKTTCFGSQCQCGQINHNIGYPFLLYFSYFDSGFVVYSVFRLVFAVRTKIKVVI